MKMTNFFKQGAIFLLFIGMALTACSKNSGGSSTDVSAVHVYYVAPDGSDGNTGSIHAPFKTITAALNKAAAGDTIIARGGTYNEKISFPKSGTADKRITLKAYAGEKPVIDGSTITVTGWMALVNLNGVRYITIDGFDICNMLSSAFNTDPEGIFINGNSKDITIRNCNIYNIKNSASVSNWRSAHAIFVIGNGTAAISNLVITGCTVHDTQTGTSENITLAGNIDGFTVSHNTIYNTENIGIIIAGGDGLNPTGNVTTNYARNGVVSDNVLYNIDMSRGPVQNGDHGAIAIYVCGGAGTVVERNRVYDSDRAIGLVSESNIYATRNCIVRNNFIYNCWRTGIYMGDYLNYTHGGTKNCYVVNNTLFQNNRVPGAFGEIEGEIRLTEYCDSNVVKNNIVYARPVDVFVHKYTSTGSNNVIDNNLYYTTGTAKWIWNGTEYTSFAAWKTACGGDGASANGIDPLLVNISSFDLHIQTGSPAKNTGVVISEVINGSTDIDGNARIVNNKISKGAQQ
ncbi:MAG TPA: right-handed parallel beta-helix repeat-containing protein [Niastella sp.]